MASARRALWPLWMCSCIYSKRLPTRQLSCYEEKARLVTVSVRCSECPFLTLHIAAASPRGAAYWMWALQVCGGSSSVLERLRLPSVLEHCWGAGGGAGRGLHYSVGFAPLFDLAFAKVVCVFLFLWIAWCVSLKCHQVVNHRPVLLEGTYIRPTFQMKNPNLLTAMLRISHKPRRNPSVLKHQSIALSSA